MKAVVTGGSGFIGSYVALELAKDPDTEVVIFDIVVPDHDWQAPENVKYLHGDIRYLEEVIEATKGADEVYDIAGVLGTSELNFANARAIDTNVGGAANVLEACRINEVSRIFHPTKPNDWLNTYSITKFGSEQFCLQYAQEYNMNIVCLKWFNAYGTRQHPYPIRKLLPTLCIQASRGVPMGVFGNGEQTVDLIHVEDIAKIVVHCTRNHYDLGKVIDVGSGDAMTVNAVAKIVGDASGKEWSVNHLPMRVGEPERTSIKADVVELRSIYDFELRDVTEGLIETYEYYAGLPDHIVHNSFRYWGENPVT
jgi:UDP-glucose 4-epimerase